MSHFCLIVCIDDPEKLDEALAPFDEGKQAEPYRDYEDGEPKDFWAVGSLREESALNPDDATLTWAEVAAAFNTRYPDSRDPMLIAEDGRAYTMSTYNPQSKWDYWRVGGRWGGYFRYREGLARQVMLPGRGWDSPDSTPGTCDGGPKSALDLAAMREAKAEEARKTYAEFHNLVAGTPEARPWSELVELIDKVAGYTIDQARKEYHSQPRVQALRETSFRWHDDAIATFQKPERLYIETERARAVPGYAVLTTDGRWMAPGRMGWFGCGTDTESDRIGYWEVANAYLDSLPESTWLIAVDCHI